MEDLDRNNLYTDVLEELALMLDKDSTSIHEASKDELQRRKKDLIDELIVNINNCNVFEVKILELLKSVDIITIVPKLIINYMDTSIINEDNKKIILSLLKNITPSIEGKLATVVINIFIMEEICEIEEIPKMYKKIFEEFLKSPKLLINNIILGTSLEEDLDLCLSDFKRITHISDKFNSILIKNITLYATNLIVLILFGFSEE